MGEKQLHVVMYPWFAFGHMIPYLHLSNKLAENYHKVTFIVPNKAISRLQSLNLHPSLITFHTITVPHVDPLPPGTETGSDVPITLHTHLATAVDLTRPEFESIITALHPDIIFFDSAYWVPAVASKLGIKTVSYNVISAATLAINMVPARKLPPIGSPVTEDDVASPPPGYPSSTIVLEPKRLLYVAWPLGEGLRFYERITGSLSSADVIALRTTRELEGQFCDYLSSQYNKPVILSGPVLPDPDTNLELEARWATWLGKFEVGSVVFCSFGSQIVLDVSQFQELLLGIEMTNAPFLVAFKPPKGYATVEEAFPDGFMERVGERGLVTEWVQQLFVLKHPSVGCFVNHCAFGTMWESLLSDKQLVLIPHLGDQILNTKMLANEMKVAVEVERGKDGWVSKEKLCEAIKSVMNNNDTKDDGEIGSLVKKNHEIWRQKLGHSRYMSDYMHNFIQDLYNLAGI